MPFFSKFLRKHDKQVKDTTTTDDPAEANDNEWAFVSQVDVDGCDSQKGPTAFSKQDIEHLKEYVPSLSSTLN